MWYECIPPLLIIGVAMAIPAYASPYLNKLATGHKNFRTFETMLERIGVAMDNEQGNGDYWKFNGLDSIPDK